MFLFLTGGLTCRGISVGWGASSLCKSRDWPLP